MPYLKIIVSKTIDANRKHALLTAASAQVVAALGKPEQYMMVSVEAPVQMLFAGSEEACAFLELRAIGLPKSKAGRLTQLLGELVETHLGIRKDRVYINFTDVPPSQWGWNGQTF